MEIRNATIEDIDEIRALERNIDEEYPATKETLLERLEMFPDGFYVVEIDGKIVGYIETCLWDKEDIETFDKIKDFPKQHDPKGKTAYVIFIGVGADYRRQGVGSALIQEVQKLASERGLKKVQLVAIEEDLLGFYGKLGFEFVKKLPNYYRLGPGFLMEHSEK